MRLRETVARHGLLSAGDRVLCALSGGADSVCMTHLLASLRAEYGVTLAAAHFTHGLRPQRAEEERRFCAELCASLELPLFCGEGDTRAYAAARHRGVEESARALRYDFLERTAAEWGATSIATAHNQNDQIETVLFRLLRGGGARGLSGIPVRRGPYIRPMLETGRDEIEAYLTENGLTYLTDESNADLRYARNRLRREVLPLLERVHPGAGASIVSAASLLAQDDDCLEGLAAALTDGASASASALTAAHPALAGRAVQRLWRAAGGTADLYRRQVEAVLRLCAGDCPSGGVDLPGGLTARRSYDTLTLGPALPAAERPAPAALVPGVPLRFGGWEVLLREAAAGEPGLPAAALRPPLTVRARAEGDRIALSGGSRSLKKWMIDQKIPKEMRDTVPVVCDTEGVLALPGGVRVLTEASGERVSIIFRRIEK